MGKDTSNIPMGKPIPEIGKRTQRLVLVSISIQMGQSMKVISNQIRNTVMEKKDSLTDPNIRGCISMEISLDMDS